MRTVLNGAAWLIYGFLVAPIAVVLSASFTAGNFISFPPDGLSLRWYFSIFEDADFMASLRLSLIEACLVAGATLVLVIPAVVGLTRGSYPGRAALAAFYGMPLTVPRIVLAAALLGFLSLVGLRGTLSGLVIGHTLIACPLAFWILSAAFAGRTLLIERAAVIHGASPIRAFFTTTLRLVMPGIVAAGIFAFIAAFDDVPIALFLSSPTLVTLPVRIYNYVDQSLTPIVTSASSLLIFIVAAVVFVVDRTIGLGRAFGIKDAKH